jgi:hypothetical protein
MNPAKLKISSTKRQISAPAYRQAGTSNDRKINVTFGTLAIDHYLEIEIWSSGFNGLSCDEIG